MQSFAREGAEEVLHGQAIPSRLILSARPWPHLFCAPESQRIVGEKPTRAPTSHGERQAAPACAADRSIAQEHCPVANAAPPAKAGAALLVVADVRLRKRSRIAMKSAAIPALFLPHRRIQGSAGFHGTNRRRGGTRTVFAASPPPPLAPGVLRGRQRRLFFVPSLRGRRSAPQGADRLAACGQFKFGHIAKRSCDLPPPPGRQPLPDQSRLPGRTPSLNASFS